MKRLSILIVLVALCLLATPAESEARCGGRAVRGAARVVIAPGRVVVRGARAFRNREHKPVVRGLRFVLPPYRGN